MSGAYPLFLLAGIAVTLWWWRRLARRDERLLLIYIAALVGAFVGAKLVYLLAEGWMFWESPERWQIWATGKSILGALLGGYASVEAAKRALGYRQATGDFFALVAPVGIILGRVGCLLHGCCPGRECAQAHWWTLRDAAGVERWPAVPIEIAFNVAMLGLFLRLRSGSVAEPKTRNSTPETLLPGQHFHLYLIAYGCFRFVHEFVRDTPRIGLGISGYQIAALACVALGAGGFVRRARGRQGQGGA